MSVHLLGSTTRAVTALVTGTLLAATLAGCSDGASGEERDAEAAGQPGQSAEVAPVRITDNLKSPRSVSVDTRVELSAEGGKLRTVTARAVGGDVLAGKVGEAGRTWTAAGRLEPGTKYLVRTTSVDSAGDRQRDVHRFRTDDLTLDEQTFASVAPLDGETVGVGMPVTVSFDIPVTDKASIERHLKVTSSPQQVGTWHWISDTEVHWRPKTYWQAGTDVTVDVDINSVPAGNGIYGQESRMIQFSVGDANIYKVNAKTHQMQVFSNGEMLRTIPVTMGKDGFTTRSGTKVIMELFRERAMRSETIGISDESNPEYYDLDDVEYAMRLTYSGEFLHAAPWSVASQGSANVSHGCTGMSTADAAWLYGMSKRGDVVEYVGTDRPMTLTNGYGDWNASFAEYADGSAL